LSKEQALDYGSILESLTKLFNNRQPPALLKPISQTQQKDLLTLLWEGFINDSSSLGGSGGASGSGQKRKRNSFEKAFLRVGEKLERDIINS